LRDELEVGEAALPVVLLLLDQLYDLRRQLRELGVAFTRVVPEDVQRNLATHLMGGSNK
jgi:chaperone modulatory protein CbpM